MTAQEIWASFQMKLKDDVLCEEDFTKEMKLMKDFLTGPESLSRRMKYSSAPAQYFETEEKAIVFLNCPDDKYRFDFIKTIEGYKLSFIECITLPISNLNIKTLPYDHFIPLSDKEIHIRREKEISKTISIYLKFKELIGNAAIKIFMDGCGENIAARSWVPFYNERLAYIAYAAWIENRINGEDVVITEFTEDRSVIRCRNHIWRSMYRMTSHLKTQIAFDEYMWFFEEIWRDRAKANGWSIEFTYNGDDTIMIFKR